MELEHSTLVVTKEFQSMITLLGNYLPKRRKKQAKLEKEDSLKKGGKRGTVDNLQFSVLYCRNVPITSILHTYTYITATEQFQIPNKVWDVGCTVV